MRKPSSRQSHQTNHHSYQSLEIRQLLAGMNFSASTGQVFVGGYDTNDSVVVSEQTVDGNAQVSVRFEYRLNGVANVQTETYPANEVESIAFVALEGDDTFENNTSKPSFVYAGAGNDVLIGGSARDVFFGDAGNDRLLGNGGEDALFASIGDDFLDGGEGDDSMLGTAGLNEMRGGPGNDVIYGGNDRDIIDGGDGNDALFGLKGNDEMTGGRGDDLVMGHEGNDELADGSGRNVLYSGVGNDTVSGGSGTDFIFGDSGEDTINGGAGVDYITGGDGNDLIFGGLGADLIQGQAGNDIIHGGELRGDVIAGDNAKDFIVGGAGRDTVQYAAGQAQYTVKPFNSGNYLVTDQRSGKANNIDNLQAVEALTFAGQPLQSFKEYITIQPVIVSNDNGSNQSTYLGTAEQEQLIKERISTIYGQADVGVRWLTAKEWKNSTANNGSGGTRNPRDIFDIVANGDQAKVGSSNPNVIDLYFVANAPGFGALNQSQVAGQALIDSSGTAVEVGSMLLTFPAGQNLVAQVIAHEIGHNFGLEHGGTRAGNLMFGGSAKGDAIQLTSAQIKTIIDSSLTTVS